MTAPDGILSSRETYLGAERVESIGVYTLLPRRTRRSIDRLVAKGVPLPIAIMRHNIQPFIDNTKKETNDTDKPAANVSGEAART